MGSGCDFMMLAIKRAGMVVVNLQTLQTMVMTWEHENRVTVCHARPALAGRRHGHQTANQQQRDTDPSEGTLESRYAGRQLCECGQIHWDSLWSIAGVNDCRIQFNTIDTLFTTYPVSENQCST